VVCFGIIIGVLFLEETHEAKKLRRDPGLECGKWILSQFSRCSSSGRNHQEKAGWEAVPLLDEGDLPSYQSAEPSPVLKPTRLDDCVEVDAPLPAARKVKAAASAAFTPQVIRNIVGYGILAL